jgi:hypothetical protein
VLPFSKSQRKETVDGLDDLLRPARLEIDFATLLTYPSLKARQLDLNAFLLKLLRDCLSSHSSLALGTWSF